MSEKDIDINGMKQRRSFREVISHNLGLKILSVIFAVLLWCYVVSETNPIRSMTYKEVEITVAGLDQLKEKKLIPLDDLSEKLPTVKVNLNVPYREISTMSQSNIVVTLDLSGITQEGTYKDVPLKVKVANTDVTVGSFSPSSVDVVVQKIATSEIPITISATGKLPDHLYRGTPTVKPQTLQISGPESYITCISRARVDVDLAKMTDGFESAMQYTFIDKDGNEVSSANIDTDSDTVLVNMGILTKKIVPIEFLSRIKNMDKLAEGYEIKETDIRSSIDSVTVIGTKDKLDELDKIYINDIDVTGFDANNKTVDAELIVPEGVRVLEPIRPVISFNVRQKQITKEFEKEVEYKYDAELQMPNNFPNATVKVSVKGNYFDVLAVEQGDIKVIADLNGLGVGLHNVNLAVQMPNQNNFEITVDPAVVVVELNEISPPLN